jgi:hypothetical protein
MAPLGEGEAKVVEVGVEADGEVIVRSTTNSETPTMTSLAMGISRCLVRLTIPDARTKVCTPTSLKPF